MHITNNLDEVRRLTITASQCNLASIQIPGKAYPVRQAFWLARRCSGVLKLCCVKLVKFKYHFIAVWILIWTHAIAAAAQLPAASWAGVLLDARGKIIASAQVELRDAAMGRVYTARSDEHGGFSFPQLPAGTYTVRVIPDGKAATPPWTQKIMPNDHLKLAIQVGSISDGWQIAAISPGEKRSAAGAGQNLSDRQVSELPLNKRDFSQLLLLAAGTMTDTNDTANFTEQFAVNGQRGATAVFAMDGVDMTDPELGGATFTNFNVDAVEEIESASGVMTPEFGHGASGFTNIKTKAGTNLLHGTLFEFVRNSDLDARNFFDERSLAQPGRIPPFVRNEFGFTLGGPVTLPGIYQGRDRTFFFGQYQGFRQVLGTTQVLSVPTQAERQGLDTSAFPGDTLHVPVNSQSAPILAEYPGPNDPEGSYGARTYATSSKVATVSNQFSVRIDHRISAQSNLFARFNLDNVKGPVINPDQEAINPSFATQFSQPQRNLGLNYTRTVSPHFNSETSLGYIRSTPLFLPGNHTQPGMTFADSLYSSFNAPAGTVGGFFGNLFQVRQNFTYVRGAHTLKFGLEIRSNHDSAIYATNPNGEYTFGGGTAYAPAEIPSLSGRHDIAAGSPLPDALSGFLSASPFSYNTTAALSLTPQGDRFGEVAMRRGAYDFFWQDAWKVTPRFTLNYGLRYEVNSRLREAERRTSTFLTVDANGKTVPAWQAGARQIMVLNPQPPYQLDLNGWGPRASVEWRVSTGTVLSAGGGITTMLPPLGQTVLAGVFPFVVSPNLTASPAAPVPFENAVATLQLPPVYTTSGQLAFPTGRTTDVAPNTELDVPRFQTDLSALTPGHQPQPLAVFGTPSDLPNGYIENFTAGIEQKFNDVVVNVAYVGTAGVKLVGAVSPNSYSGASPEFAPFTQFDSGGNIVGGYGPETLVGTPSHSTYHALQVSVSKNSARRGLGFESSYTFSKSLDDSSAVVFSFSGPASTVIQALPQNPWNPGADKGPSTFDISQAFSGSVIQLLPLQRVNFLHPLGNKFLAGWQVLNITTLTSGSPFSVYSGIQQTGVGSAGAERPDQIAVPDFSTHRTVREDYFGRGTSNAAFFNIPIGVPGGTGPNQGRFGTLGRNTFRGPGYSDLDMALIKDTTLSRHAGSEPATLEFRAEFFNAFNLVNFGLPSNIVSGSGFGIINHTAGTSRQIQFSLKLLF
jgi:hypothetical protein